MAKTDGKRIYNDSDILVLNSRVEYSACPMEEKKDERKRLSCVQLFQVIQQYSSSKIVLTRISMQVEGVGVIIIRPIPPPTAPPRIDSKQSSIWARTYTCQGAEEVLLPLNKGGPG